MISLAGSYDFETFFGKKGGRLHANETKPSQRKGKANAYENNEAEPVTIGYRLGVESMCKTQAIVQLTISNAVCTGIPGLSRCFEPSSANVACIPGTARHAQIMHARTARQHQARITSASRHPTPSVPRAHAIDLRCQSQTRPGYPAPGRAGCLPACPSYAPGPRRPQPREWSPRRRSGFRQTACPPR